MKNGVAVVVITYNGEEDISAFLDTYKAHTLPEVSLVVVDNASSDKTIDIVRAQYPPAAILQNTINHGFAGGARQGMEYAIAHGAEYIAVVNQDLRFEKRWLEPLVAYLDTNERCAAVQPRIMMYPNTDTINSYGNAQHYLGFGYTLGYKKTSSAFPCENNTELATCSGAATLFRAEALSLVDLIDARLFLYHEDSDLSWRLRMAGFTLALCCASTVYHRYEFSRSITKFYYMERNRYIIMLTNYSLRTLVLILPMFLVMEAGMIGYSIAAIFFGKKETLTLGEKMRSMAYFFLPSSWRYIAAKRRASQRQRTVSDKEITRLFADIIEFQDIDSPVLRRIVNPLTHLYWTWIQKLL